ncbi:MAG: hypothetical protein ABIP74_01850 [Candidatus Saccharimonas sp.]
MYRLKPFVGLVIVALSVFATWIAMGPAKMDAKGALVASFLIAAVITLVVIVGSVIGVSTYHRPKRTLPRVSWESLAVVVGIVLIVVVALVAASSLFVVGEVKLTLTLSANGSAILWGIATALPIAAGLLLYNWSHRPVAITSTQTTTVVDSIHT